jgi:hypothetical protein
MKYVIFVNARPYAFCTTLTKVYRILIKFDDFEQLPLTMHVFRKRVKLSISEHGYYAISLASKNIRIHKVKNS